ncbi:DUF1232 domain-containing protein [Streptosporangiaceae bacterium NEAU-GS5]|nr:DUF1232 domain-containing protein [Streptosporangiaceae bacterium NEAU-GS5]
MVKSGKARRAAQAYRAYSDIVKPGTPGLGARLRAIPRMLRAARRGEYPEMGKGKLWMLALSVVYILSPIDVIPDFLLGIGIVDDFGVLVWLASTLLGDSGRYIEWQRQSLSMRSQARDGRG